MSIFLPATPMIRLDDGIWLRGLALRRMKIRKTEGSRQTGRIGAHANTQADPRQAPQLNTVPPSSGAPTLGIPEAEFTPHVRDAIVTLMHDVDRLKRELEQTKSRLEDLSRTADQDMLLPILNRRAFVAQIARFIGLAERYGTPASILYFDLDDFKAVNDAHGHAAGDAVLHHFADMLASQIRDTDVLARIGGDEFGIILAHVNLVQARKKGASLAQALRKKPPVWAGKPVPLSFSHGVYELRAGENPDTAIAAADRAMYAQKRSER
jgi:diguanylate cyclase (GGDEF)-like protein